MGGRGGVVEFMIICIYIYGIALWSIHFDIIKRVNKGFTLKSLYLND